MLLRGKKKKTLILKDLSHFQYQSSYIYAYRSSNYTKKCMMLGKVFQN